MKKISPSGDALRSIAKRPSIIWFTGAFTLSALAINRYNPLMPILSGMGRVTGGNIFESIMSFLQVAAEPRMLGIVLFLVTGLSLISALLAGFIFPGYLKMISNTLTDDVEKTYGFIRSFKKYFLKTLLMTFVTAFSGLAFLAFMSVVSVPAIVTTRAALSGRIEISIAALFIDLLTAVVILLGFMFFRIYFLFWYTAAFSDDLRPFRAGKMAADNNFLSIALRFAAFDIFFILIRIAIVQIKDPAALFLASWVFITFFLSYFITYVFSIYKAFR